MTTTVSALRLDPLTVPTGQPLRVAVYTSLADAIRGGRVELGSLLPNEAELGVALRVSRTVVREALMLLEEDGLIRTRRGIGRFVAEALPQVGLELLQPLEKVIAEGSGTVSVERMLEELQPTSDFITRGLQVDPGAQVWVQENVLKRDGEAVAQLLEIIPSAEVLAERSPVLAARLDEIRVDGRSLLAAVMDIVGPVLGPAVYDVTVGRAGAERGKGIGLKASTPVLVLTHNVLLDGKPIYLAKNLITHGFGTLTIAQSAT
ncbi:GntR family transcriptional regulator [Herbiconiux ginsengi]|uniref:Transcriptional regulator, GntR family n=1 Tax=Herbiconiux ginsengi TaxID=381665 RepID=A0A1H3Q908_9MICO|nr:GntR family transcriptional regulator [Herbiconiux ginsengi]SDZ09495.1 transcriptional regulator, GntR family [Herbiconiux ginsengi]